MTWVVSLPILSHFGPRRATATLRMRRPCGSGRAIRRDAVGASRRAPHNAGPERRQDPGPPLRHEVHGREHQDAALRPPHDHDGPGPRRVLPRRRISPSRGAAAPSRRRRASSSREEVGGGFSFDFEAVRTARCVTVTRRSHIKGLLINCLHHFWPSLLEIPGFLRCFITPIVKATSNSKKGPSKTFFTVPSRRP